MKSVRLPLGHAMMALISLMFQVVVFVGAVVFSVLVVWML